MRLVLIRHGDASLDSPLGDRGRNLSQLGRRQAEATGRALAGQGVGPTQVWSSPLVRAVQTAELVIGAFADYDGVIEARDDLYPDSPLASLVRALGELGDDETVLVVGHQPYMGNAASTLLGYSVSGFPTSAAYVLRVVRRAPIRVELDWRWLG